jgi:ribosome-associated translation inhibitor RaiA
MDLFYEYICRLHVARVCTTRIISTNRCGTISELPASIFLNVVNGYSMIITAATQKLELEDEEKAYIDFISHKLTDRFLLVYSLRWRLTLEKSNIVVKCLVHSQSGYYQARATADTLQYAVNLVFEKIIVQRKKKRQRIYPQRIESLLMNG